MADDDVSERPVPVDVVSRRRPFVVRYPQVAVAGYRGARSADVVYATATYAAAAVAATAAREPLVVKLVSDPAFERAFRYRAFTGSLEAFQREGSARARVFKGLRTASLRRARRVVVPSRYLADMAIAWGIPAARVEVLVNPAPTSTNVEPAQLADKTFVFVGRLTEQKALTVLFDALVDVPDARVELVGDGPQRTLLERRAEELGIAGRVGFMGALPRHAALAHLAGARAAVLPSAWENLPHAAVEALSVGVPVVATAVGGVPEVVHDGENGLLVPPNDPARLAAALSRVLASDAFRDELAGNARASVASIGRDAIYGRLEQILEEAAAA
jgi:glycosyltransferase involved in cell wall biosynthesis